LSVSNIMPTSEKSTAFCRCNGRINNCLPLAIQGDNLDVELGAGYGFTPGSDRFTVKAIIGMRSRHPTTAVRSGQLVAIDFKNGNSYPPTPKCLALRSL
jgi:hypothetical protein